MSEKKHKKPAPPPGDKSSRERYDSGGSASRSPAKAKPAKVRRLFVVLLHTSDGLHNRIDLKN